MKFLAFFQPLLETLKGVVPLATVLVFVQVVLLKKPLADVKSFAVGLVFTVLGLHFFLRGANLCLIPLGETVGSNLYTLNNRWLVVALGCLIGYFSTLVEPALGILAMEVEELSVGAISRTVLLHGVALGFGLGMGLGLWRLMSDVNYLKVLIPLLLLVGGLAVAAPKPFTEIAMDAAASTTGPVNIPVNMAIALGLASSISGLDPLMAGFGLVGLTSLGSMVAALVLPLLARL